MHISCLLNDSVNHEVSVTYKAMATSPNFNRKQSYFSLEPLIPYLAAACPLMRPLHVIQIPQLVMWLHAMLNDEKTHYWKRNLRLWCQLVLCPCRVDFISTASTCRRQMIKVGEEIIEKVTFNTKLRTCLFSNYWTFTLKLGSCGWRIFHSSLNLFQKWTGLLSRTILL